MSERERLINSIRSQLDRARGALGGQARATKLTKAKRSAIAKKAAQARWKKQ